MKNDDFMGFTKGRLHCIDRFKAEVKSLLLEHTYQSHDKIFMKNVNYEVLNKELDNLAEKLKKGEK